MDNEQFESLWARISEQTNIGSIVATTCYTPPDQEDVIRLPSHDWRKPCVHISWASWGHPDVCWRNNTSNPEVFLSALMTKS